MLSVSSMGTDTDRWLHCAALSPVQMGPTRCVPVAGWKDRGGGEGGGVLCCVGVCCVRVGYGGGGEGGEDSGRKDSTARRAWLGRGNVRGGAWMGGTTQSAGATTQCQQQHCRCWWSLLVPTLNMPAHTKTCTPTHLKRRPCSAQKACPRLARTAPCVCCPCG